MKRRYEQIGAMVIGIALALTTAVWAENPANWSFMLESTATGADPAKGADVTWTSPTTVDDGVHFIYTYTITKVEARVLPIGGGSPSWQDLTKAIAPEDLTGSDRKDQPLPIEIINERLEQGNVGADVQGVVDVNGYAQLSVTNVAFGNIYGLDVSGLRLTGTVHVDRLMVLNTLTGQGDGTLAVSDGTTTTDPATTTTFKKGTGVTITAKPAAGYRFGSWVIDGTPSSKTGATLTMALNADTTVTANFIQQVGVTASVEGTGGTVSPSGTTAVDVGGTIKLTATPKSGYAVKEWEVNGLVQDTTAKTITLTISKATTVVVRFNRVYTLTAATADANGTVSPSGQTTHAAGTKVTLTATPNDGYWPSTWTVNGLVDATADMQDTCVVTMNADTTVVVAFAKAVTSYKLTTGVIGGHGTLMPVTGEFPKNAAVTLTATPESGYRVKKWTGTDNNSATTTTNVVTMSSDKTVMVQFGAIPATSVEIDGVDSVGESEPLALTCVVTADDGSTFEPQSGVTWSVISGGGSIDAKGVYTAPAVTADTAVTIGVTYANALGSVSDEKDITVINTMRGLTKVQIVGDTELVDGEAATYLVKLTYDDATTETTNADTWAVDSEQVHLAADGRLTLSALGGEYLQIKITATIDGLTATLKVNINTPIDPVPEVPGGCFIATAAYGSLLDSHVATLRQFRDEQLMTTAAGQAFVKTYYTVSPPMADVIARNPSLRSASRAMLTPMVLAVTHPAKVATVVLLFVMVLLLAKRRYRKDNSCQ